VIGLVLRDRDVQMFLAKKPPLLTVAEAWPSLPQFQGTESILPSQVRHLGATVSRT